MPPVAEIEKARLAPPPRIGCDRPLPPAPPRPARWREALASRLFLAFAPPLAEIATPKAPQTFHPFQTLHIPRSEGQGTLSATWFPARSQQRTDGRSEARGVVLFLHPWLRWGRAYFHRRRRIEAVRAAGYHALTLDFGGFGDSGPATGFFDRDVRDALAFLRRAEPGLSIHLWAVSAGGYWAHFVLAQEEWVAGALFEDVSCHLFEWSKRIEPWGRPFYRLFEWAFADWYRFLDLRHHASRLRVAAAAYVSGANDVGVLPEETRDLADRAGAACRIVPDADHLDAIKRRGPEVIELALATFELAAMGR